ncbi:DUF1302 domain-containing protein [uncultured Dechloromonas sp.]|uniref:DUF1302 domain-containing protein n=1 Tax=uncultured Dechloromonas sp. TaxID=171719 RepID=UPI003427098A
MRKVERTWHRKTAAAAVMACFAGGAAAVQFETENGWQGSWTNTLSVGASWRAEGQDNDLVPRNAASFGMVNGSPSSYPNTGNGKKIGNLNYDKGDMYSLVYKFLSEFNVKRDRTAVVVSAKGWYDQAQKDGSVPWGNMAAWGGTRSASNPAQPTNEPLSDAGAPVLSRFAGVALLDAYVSQGFDVGDAPSQVRVGRQVVNWGEGLFIRGLNLHNAIDVPAARRAGSEIKEALLPTLALQASTTLPIGVSLEGFYQLRWEPSAVDYCGTFWNMSHSTIGPKAGRCNVMEAVAAGGNLATMQGGIITVPQADGKEPNKAGAWGLATRFPIDAIDTEFGLYAMNMSAALPAVSARGTVAGSGFINVTTATMQFDYLDNIKVYGASAATNLFGWSVGAELSYHQGIPVNYYEEDMKNSLGTAGPLQAKFRQQFAGKTGQIVSFDFYERFNKTQFTLNGLKTFDSLASYVGANQLNVLGEVGFEWNNVPDYKSAGSARFGRGGPLANDAGGNITTACNDTGAAQWCKNDGFVTPFSWGYRLRGQLTYSGIFGSGWEAKPTLFFAHDVQGVSLDGQFQEDRKTLGLGVEFNLDKKHTIYTNYTTYTGKWNLTRDHDNLSVAYSYKF